MQTPNSMSEEAEIETRVKAIIADKLKADEKEITRQSHFTNDLGADSLDVVELIMEFETAFNITIPDREAVQITTVGDVIEYLKKNVIWSRV